MLKVVPAGETLILAGIQTALTHKLRYASDPELGLTINCNCGWQYDWTYPWNEDTLRFHYTNCPKAKVTP